MVKNKSHLNLLNPIICLVVLFVVFGCQEKSVSTKEETDSTWYKGNLHTHSYWSDGDEFPEMIMNWYKSKGYHFLALSDHNILAQDDKWIKIKAEATYQNAFQDYLKEYGSDWVNYRNDSDQIEVKLKTLAEYRDRFEKNGEFLIIQSEEISDEFEEKPIHLNATNIQTLINPQGGISVADVMQRNIDAVNKQRRETGIPMIPHINHPNFGYAISMEDMLVLNDERFFEVYNGHPQVHNLGDSLHMSIEDMWDLINISYLENNKPLMYGLATDDAHHYHIQGKKWSNAGRGWIMVEADTLTPGSLITAMEAGRFYASTGVVLKHITFDGQTLSVAIDPDPDVTYTITFIGCQKGESSSEVLQSTQGIQGSFKWNDDLIFVRSKITSSKPHENPIEELLYEMAWTQPITN